MQRLFIKRLLAVPLCVLFLLSLSFFASPSTAFAATSAHVQPVTTSEGDGLETHRKLAKIISDILTLGNRLEEGGGKALSFRDGFVIGVCIAFEAGRVTNPLIAKLLRKPCSTLLEDQIVSRCSDFFPGKGKKQQFLRKACTKGFNFILGLEE